MYARLARSLALLAIVHDIPTVALAQTWNDLAAVPAGTIQEHATLLLRGRKLATVGGLLPNGSTSDLLLIYDITRNSWRQGTSVPTPLNHPNTAVHDGKIYILGGLTGGWPWPSTADSWVYDPEQDSWTSRTGMPAAETRGSAASAVHNGTIYLAGGISTGSGPTMDLVTAYNTLNDTWVQLPEAAARLPEARDHMAYAQLGTKFYILGGRKDGGEAVKDTVFILDLADLAAGWTTSTARMPTARGGLTGAAIGATIYTFGGEGNPAPGTQGVFNQTEAYDTETDSWSTLPAMKLPRHGTSAVASSGKIYVPGGGIVMGAGGTGVFDVFTP